MVSGVIAESCRSTWPSSNTLELHPSVSAVTNRSCLTQAIYPLADIVFLGQHLWTGMHALLRAMSFGLSSQMLSKS